MEDINNHTYTVKIDQIYSPEGKSYHRVKYIPKIEKIKSYLALKPTNKLLDIGVGYGSFLNLIEETLDIETYGLDPYSESIEITRRYTKADIRNGRIEDSVWPFDFKFEIITCFDVIEHLENPSVFFKHVKQYISPDGIIIATTPLRLLPYKLRSIPLLGLKDTNPTHINVHPPSYWNHLAHEHGYEIIESWRGEHLTHVKLLPGIIGRVCSIFGLDHRKVPIINTFEQAYKMILKPISND